MLESFLIIDYFEVGYDVREKFNFKKFEETEWNEKRNYSSLKFIKLESWVGIVPKSWLE